MRPQDIVAILLTFGVLIILMSVTPIRCIWMECNGVDLMQETNLPQERSRFWDNVMNIILGGLIGYMSGRQRGR